MIKKVFPILALCMFSSMLGVGIITPLLPLYVQSMGTTGVWLGIIFAAFSTSYMITTPFIGRLSDRRGRKLFLSIGLLFYSITSLGFVWAVNVHQISLVRLAQGVAGAMITPVAQAYVGDVSPEGEEGKWMGYANAAFFSGFGFGPLIGGTLTEHFGMNVAFYSMGGLNLLAFLIATLFLPEVNRQKTEQSLHPSFTEISQSSMVRGLFSIRLGQSVGRGVIMTFLPIFAATYLGLSTSLIGILIAINVLLQSLLAPLGGRIADRFSRRALIVIGSTISLMSLAAIPSAQNFGQLLVLSLTLGIGGAISMPVVTALAVEEGRKYGMGSTMAGLTLAMSLGMIIGPISAGVIADAINIDAVFFFVAGAILTGTGLFIRFTK